MSAKTIGRHFNKTFDSLRRTKEEIGSIFDSMVRGEWTHTQMLDALKLMYERKHYKELPRWARSEITGYSEMFFGVATYRSLINRETKMMHLYQGELYVSFDEWRGANPSDDASGLTDSCVSVWRNSYNCDGIGKIYFVSKEYQNILQGMKFPAYNVMHSPETSENQRADIMQKCREHNQMVTTQFQARGRGER